MEEKLLWTNRTTKIKHIITEIKILIDGLSTNLDTIKRYICELEDASEAITQMQ